MTEEQFHRVLFDEFLNSDYWTPDCNVDVQFANFLIHKLFLSTK